MSAGVCVHIVPSALEEELEEGQDEERGVAASGVGGATTPTAPLAAPPVLPPVHYPKLQIVLTKCDLVCREDLAKRVVLLRSELSSLIPRETKLPTLMLSASKGQGLTELRKELAALFIKNN